MDLSGPLNQAMLNSAGSCKAVFGCGWHLAAPAATFVYRVLHTVGVLALRRLAHNLFGSVMAGCDNGINLREVRACVDVTRGIPAVRRACPLLRSRIRGSGSPGCVRAEYMARLQSPDTVLARPEVGNSLLPLATVTVSARCPPGQRKGRASALCKSRLFCVKQGSLPWCPPHCRLALRTATQGTYYSLATPVEHTLRPWLRWINCNFTEGVMAT